MFKKQREQQHLNVRAVHIRVGQDADLAITQARQVGRVIRTMGIDPNSHGNVMNLGVGKQTVALHLPGVQHLAAQGQNGLAFFIAPHLGAAPGRVTLHQKHLVVVDVAAFTVGEFAR